MNAPSHDEVDRVLRLRRKEREVRACYPCRRRKVKCDGTQPCRTCQKRNHSQICTYDPLPQASHGASNAETVSPSPARPRPSRDSRRQTSHDASNAESVSPTSARQPSREENHSAASLTANRYLRSDDVAKNYVYSGDNSVVSILREQASDDNESITRDLRSVLGLQNTFDSYPFMDSKTPQEKWVSLLSVLPQRSEVLKFFHHYRVTAYPFNPILADMDRFELDMCTYLNAHSVGELRDKDQIIDRWVTDKSVGHISLLLATLAAGAHYSDIDHSQRLELATDFARRSFHALRLANFLFRPSLDVVQALLILGNTLQNMGQSDAAWALLGTTIRLAQTMGLHTERTTMHWPEYVRTKSSTLWSTIVWQDSLLCMCYDRPPIVTVTGWTIGNASLQKTDLCYQEIMHFLCRLILDIIRPETFVGEFDKAIEALNRLDVLVQRGKPYLQSRNNCTSLQQNLEHLALKMHSSFCVSVVCRPAMKQSQSQPQHLQTSILRTRAKESLIEASRAFLEFQALSVVPLRSWSMVHTVLSSTLLLCIWEETRNDPECRDVQQRVIDVFASSDSRTVDEAGAENDGQWLSARHIRALVTLRGAFDRQRDNTVLENEALVGQGVNPNLFGSGLPDGFFDDANLFDNSPVSYLDMIMNVPMFDLNQENIVL